MSRKLWLLNFVLIVAISGEAWKLRKERQEMQIREHATLSSRPAVPPPPAARPVTPAPSVVASAYLDIAQKMLWAKDRNSQVIVDPPKPPEPPKPLPPLPSVHGVLNLGDGPIVMMSDGPNSRHRGVRPGETIGKFKLVSVDSENLVLAFEDRTVKKTLQELIDRSEESNQVAATNAGGARTVNAGTSSSSAPAAAAAPPAPVGKPEPGVMMTEDTSSCQSGDPSPAGTVVNGMRKVVMQTPFGPACKWEKVK